MQPSGVILNTASIQGYDPSPHLAVCAATEAAILSPTKSIADPRRQERRSRECGRAEARLDAAYSVDDAYAKVKEFGANTAFGQPAQPVELARIFVNLASDDASYVTGEVYGATGGHTPF